jgi:DNA-binding PadR family transcriptional regulator
VAHPPVDPRSFLPLTPLAFQVLLALADTSRHGYGIILEVAGRTDGLITLRTGTLYTLLQRLIEDALIEPVTAEALPSKTARERRGAEGPPRASGPGGVQGAPPIKDDPRRKYYGLTALGRDVLSAEARRLESVLSDARRKHVIKRA